MKKTNITLLSVIISAIFAAGIIYFIAGIIADHAAGPENARKYFNRLTNNTQDVVSQYDLGTNEFASGFINGIDDFQRYNRLTLKSDSAVIYDYTSQSNAAKSLTAAFASTVTTKNGMVLYLSAELYTLSPISIFYRARVSFLLILAGTVAAVILILFLNFEESPRDDSLDLYNTDISIEPYESDEKELRERAKAQFEEESREDYVPPQETAAPLPLMESEETVQKTDEMQNDIITEDAVPSEDSPDSWLLPQDRFESDLEAELIKSASTAHDVSLIILKFLSSEPMENETLNSVLTMIREKTADCGYFYHLDDGYALIIENSSLDTAMELSENLHTDSQSLLDLSKGERMIMGISSRTERILSAKRLVTEAQQAVDHAAEDPESPIIAFRVNPEKYRQYILNNEI